MKIFLIATTLWSMQLFATTINHSTCEISLAITHEIAAYNWTWLIGLGKKGYFPIQKGKESLLLELKVDDLLLDVVVREESHLLRPNVCTTNLILQKITAVNERNSPDQENIATASAEQWSASRPINCERSIRKAIESLPICKKLMQLELIYVE